MRILSLAVLTILVLTPFAAQAGDENRVFLDGWSYSRERKTITGSNRVSANLKLKNVSDASLNEVSVELTYWSGLGEKVAGPITQKVGTLKAKETKALTLTAEFVPIFGAYRVVVTYAGGKETWASNSDTGNPAPQAEKALEGVACVVVLGQEASPDRANRLAGAVRVKNEGTLDAKNVKLTVFFYADPPDKGGKKKGERVKLGEWTGKLGDGTLAGGAEKNVPFTVPVPCPKGYTGFELKVGSEELAPEAQMSGGEFQNAKGLEAAHYKFKRSGPKEENLDVTCDLRNGFDAAVEGAKLTLNFFTLEKGEKKLVKSHTQDAGRLDAGQVVPLAFTIAKIPKYDAFEQCTDCGGAAAAKPKAAAAPAGKTVTVAIKDASTQDDGTVVLICEARNGLPNLVKELTVTARFFRADGKEITSAQKTLPDPVPAGETRNFVLRAPGAKGYERCGTEVTYQEQRAPAVPAGVADETGKPNANQAKD